MQRLRSDLIWIWLGIGLTLALPVLAQTSLEVRRNHYEDGRVKREGAVEWTIKDGTLYHGATLMARVKELVDQARAAEQPASGG